MKNKNNIINEKNFLSDLFPHTKKLVLPIINEVFSDTLTEEHRMDCEYCPAWEEAGMAATLSIVTQDDTGVPVVYVVTLTQNDKDGTALWLHKWGIEEPEEGNQRFKAIDVVKLYFCVGNEILEMPQLKLEGSDGTNLSIGARVMKVGDYSLEELLVKKLYLLIPFYFLKYVDMDKALMRMEEEHNQVMDFLEDMLVRNEIKSETFYLTGYLLEKVIANVAFQGHLIGKDY